jgi:hypothetical protein
MPITLQDAVRTRDPSSPHAFPEFEGEATLRAPRTLAEELLAAADRSPRTISRRNTLLMRTTREH